MVSSKTLCPSTRTLYARLMSALLDFVMATAFRTLLRLCLKMTALSTAISGRLLPRTSEPRSMECDRTVNAAGHPMFDCDTLTASKFLVHTSHRGQPTATGCKRSGVQFQLLIGAQVYSLSQEGLEQAISECVESSELICMHCIAADEEVPADPDLAAHVALLDLQACNSQLSHEEPWRHELEASAPGPDSTDEFLPSSMPSTRGDARGGAAPLHLPCDVLRSLATHVLAEDFLCALAPVCRALAQAVQDVSVWRALLCARTLRSGHVAPCLLVLNVVLFSGLVPRCPCLAVAASCSSEAQITQLVCCLGR